MKPVDGINGQLAVCFSLSGLGLYMAVQCIRLSASLRSFKLSSVQGLERNKPISTADSSGLTKETKLSFLCAQDGGRTLCCQFTSVVFLSVWNY